MLVAYTASLAGFYELVTTYRLGSWTFDAAFEIPHSCYFESQRENGIERLPGALQPRCTLLAHQHAIAAKQAL